ncbi:MAG: metallopeptidase family protein [Sporichthyaceae bacterium]
MYAMEREEFEVEVGRVLENLPRRLSDRIANVAFGVEEGLERLNLLGLYEGIPLTKRTTQYAFALPDRITIYRWPILIRCDSYAEVLAKIELVVKHEIGHYFGIGDARLHELGYA